MLCLFGTFLHEFSHFAAALFLGKPEGFSVMPRIEGDVFIFGKVSARVRYRVLGVFIAGAPLVWWALLLVMVRHSLSVSTGTAMQEPNMSILMERLRAFSVRDVFSLWLVTQLFWAGKLSMQDIKTCISGLISPSGLIFVSMAALLFQLFR